MSNINYCKITLTQFSKKNVTILLFTVTICMLSKLYENLLMTF